MHKSEYLLAGGRAELARLRLQASVWEPDAATLFDEIGVGEGWRCIDVGCGAMGVLGPLSRHAGPSGQVLGVDIDDSLLASAHEFVGENSLSNVELRKFDIFSEAMPDGKFDLAHVRFMFAPLGRDELLLKNVLELVRPGGVMVVEEPCAASWQIFPSDERFTELKKLILDAFLIGGGDFDAGRRLFSMLRDAGLRDVQVRAAIHALPPRHPYLRLPLQFAASLEKRILDAQLISKTELEKLTADVARIIEADETHGLTFTLMQVWGTV